LQICFVPFSGPWTTPPGDKLGVWRDMRLADALVDYLCALTID